MAEGLKWRVNRAVRQSTLPPPSRLIMLVLAERADSKTAVIPDEHTPSLVELAAETGLGEATVKRHLVALESAGWVKRERPTPEQMARHIPSAYTLAVGFGGSERAPETANSGAQSEPAGGNPGAQSEPSGGSERAPAGAQSEPPSYISDRNHQIDLTTATADADGEGDGALFPVADSDRRSAPKADPAERFSEFYKTYPRKKAPSRAEATWIKVVKAGAEPQVIIEAAERFAAWCQRTKQDPKFIPYPATWLNDHSWDDEDEPAHTEQRPGQYTPWQDNRADPRPWAGEL